VKVHEQDRSEHAPHPFPYILQGFLQPVLPGSIMAWETGRAKSDQALILT